ncbi:hypothetical protein O3M35_002279 [Rhynocoris fuscipes]|uniref:UDP-glucuronosyltransferase n=1 Tax=Rhynocoris fuscipes TaxID=488301 RepID=A0AAW1CSG3_9HEMI
MMKLLLILVLLAATREYDVNAANILVILPYPIYSHHASFDPIIKELATRGHNVTVVSPFPQKTPVPNITDIVLPNIMKEVRATTHRDELAMGTLWFHMFGAVEFGVEICRTALITDQMKQLIADKDSKFDLVMTETWALLEPFVAFGHKFNAPVVNLISLFFMPKSSYSSGNQMPTSYVPDIVYFDFSDHMTFVERLQNMFFFYWDIFYAHVYYYRKQERLIREHFKYPGSENIPSLEEMLGNTALTISEYDFAVGYPAPLHKNVVLFAGVEMKKVEPLPEDLQKYMDESKGGVIYFSLGSIFGMASLKPYMKEAIISALNKQNHRILMKASNDSLLQKITNKNIRIQSWFPQRSILAHPNCKLFITHGGIHGTMEGFYHGVPMIAIPLVGDQRYNAKMIQTHGLGISMNIHTITEKLLTDTINEVITNPKYRENARKRSAIFKDKPISPMDNAIYWIEYVIRHKGAPHLRPAVLDLYWYQRLMLDVIAFYLLLIFLIVYILVKIIRLFFKLITWMCCSKVSKNKKSKKE